MRALILVAGAALALSACHSKEPAPLPMDNYSTVNEDEGNTLRNEIEDCNRRSQRDPRETGATVPACE